MKKISRSLMISWILLLSAPVQAEFIALVQHGQHSVYVDKNTQLHSANQVILTVLHDWAQPRPLYSAYYLSSLTQQLFDCVTQHSRVLAVSYFEKNMRYGKLLLRNDDPSEWQPIPAHGLTRQLWQRACSPLELPD